MLTDGMPPGLRLFWEVAMRPYWRSRYDLAVEEHEDLVQQKGLQLWLRYYHGGAERTPPEQRWDLERQRKFYFCCFRNHVVDHCRRRTRSRQIELSWREFDAPESSDDSRAADSIEERIDSHQFYRRLLRRLPAYLKRTLAADIGTKGDIVKMAKSLGKKLATVKRDCRQIRKIIDHMRDDDLRQQ